MTKKVKVQKKKKVSNYKARVGCWNCDYTYWLSIKKGINLPEYLVNSNPLCKRCGCDALKVYLEFKTEKEILKELILHHRLEHLSGSEEEQSTDHRHYGWNLWSLRFWNGKDNNMPPHMPKLWSKLWLFRQRFNMVKSLLII